MLLDFRDASVCAESQQQLGTLPSIRDTPLLTSVCLRALGLSQQTVNVIPAHRTVYTLILLSGLSDPGGRRRSAADQQRKEHHLQNQFHGVMCFVVERSAYPQPPEAGVACNDDVRVLISGQLPGVAAFACRVWFGKVLDRRQPATRLWINPRLPHLRQQ
jgi:hypothetical protein